MEDRGDAVVKEDVVGFHGDPSLVWTQLVVVQLVDAMVCRFVHETHLRFAGGCHIEDLPLLGSRSDRHLQAESFTVCERPVRQGNGGDPNKEVND